MPKKKYRFHFTFCNVGQGLCFTGNIHGFTFMYDCGSNSVTHLELILQRMIQHEDFRKLDMLVISHFHKDHTSGVGYLLDQGLIPKSVFIPYVTPIERLLLALKVNDEEGWYLDFLENPVGFLHGRGVTDVYIVTGNEPDAPDRIYEGIPDSPLEGPPFIRISQKKEKDKDSLDPDDMYFAERKKDHGDFYFLDHKTLFDLSGLWFFKFFNLDMPKAELDRFQKEFENEGLKDTAAILGAFKNPKLMRRLRKIYGKLPAAYNDTSLCLYHGPIRGDITEYVVSNNRWSFRNSSPSSGFLLTGDYSMENSGNFGNFSQHYFRELDTTGSYLIPHHGSRTGWQDDIVPKLPADCVWTYSVHSRSKHHPHPSVLRRLALNGVIFSEVNEIQRLVFQGYLQKV